VKGHIIGTGRRPLAWITAVAVAGALLVACGSSGSAGQTDASNGKATLTLYSGQHEETTQRLVDAFEQQTGIKVKVRNDDEATLAQQIEQEGSRSPADVFYTENSPPLMSLEQHGLLAATDPSTLALVDSKFNSPKGDWVGVSARVATLVYSTKALKASEVPTSVLDLANPKWKGKLGIAPGETDFQPIVTSIATAKGNDAAQHWLEGVKSNGASHTYPDNETLVNEVDQGKVELGIINHYYWFRLQRENGAANMHSALSYFAPRDPGYVLDVSGAGVLKSSSHQAEAQQLVAFLVSKAGQTILAHSDSFEYPIGSGVAANPALKPFDELQPTNLSISQLGDGSQAVDLLQQVQLL
jgi:iron(III) transport system substrate-binding protein